MANACRTHLGMAVAVAMVLSGAVITQILSYYKIGPDNSEGKARLVAEKEKHCSHHVPIEFTKCHAQKLNHA